MFDLFNKIGTIKQEVETAKAKLREELITATAAAGAIRVEVRGDRTINNLHIDASLLKDADTEQLEDLIVVAVNRALSQAAAREADVMKNAADGLLPPGFSL